MRDTSTVIQYLGIGTIVLLAACVNEPEPETGLKDIGVGTVDTTTRSESSTSPLAAPPSLKSTPIVLDSDDVNSPRPKPEFHTPDRITILPAPVRDSLLARGCRVPQYVGDDSSNVARGSFYG